MSHPLVVWQAGPSITLAATAETLAFALGGLTPMPAVRNFSLVAALAVLLDFFLQVLPLAVHRHRPAHRAFKVSQPHIGMAETHSYNHLV